jgi:hypothetical protein
VLFRSQYRKGISYTHMVATKGHSFKELRVLLRASAPPR